MVTPTAPVTDLALYGGRDEVKELGARLQNYMPNAQKLNNLEAQAVAQIAVAHGLDPFNGEVWGIKGDDKWYGVMVGIKGLRKCAHRQADLEGGHYWIDLSYADPKDYGEPATSIVAICILRDTRSMNAYAQSLRSLRDSGMPYDDAKAEIGMTPRIVGIGIATAGERSKLKIHQRAQKRAEADAIKKRFDVSFGAGVYTESDKEVLAMNTDAIDGQASYLDDGGNDNETDYVEENAEQPEPKAFSPAQEKILIDAGLANSDFAARGMLNLSCLPFTADADEIKKWGALYRSQRTGLDGKNLHSASESADFANAHYEE